MAAPETGSLGCARVQVVRTLRQPCLICELCALLWLWCCVFAAWVCWGTCWGVLADAAAIARRRPFVFSCARARDVRDGVGRSRCMVMAMAYETVASSDMRGDYVQ